MPQKRIQDLRPGMDNITLNLRVLRADEPKVVQTKRGSRTLSEAIVGDETGRARMTLWGKHAGTIHEGDAIRVENAFITSFKGEIQINVGTKGTITSIDDSEVVSEEEVPDITPKAPRGYRTEGRSPYRRGKGKRFRRQ